MKLLQVVVSCGVSMFLTHQFPLQLLVFGREVDGLKFFHKCRLYG
jgi:hypothetical protein